MSAPLDPTAPVRDGEGLPLDALAAWLEGAAPELAGLPLTVEQFPRGHSNLTYLLRAGDRELVLRRPPFGARIASAHDMGREHAILSGLHPHLPVVPRPIAYCPDDSVIGAPFYLMERITGLIIRKRLPAELNAGDGLVARVSDALVRALVEVHAVDWCAAGLDSLYKGEGYVVRQIEGWTRRYQAAQTDDLPEVDAVARWLADHLPPESAPTLIHNDFKHDNLVLDPDDPGRVIGILDWEMATVGDPLMDLGTTLGYWIEATDPAHIQAFAFCPSNVPGAPTRAELVAAYEAASGRAVDHPVFYFVYGLFKLAVVAQQIYRRYTLGHTRDPRFATFIFGVKLLAELATRAIERGRIDRLGA